MNERGNRRSYQVVGTSAVLAAALIVRLARDRGR